MLTQVIQSSLLEDIGGVVVLVCFTVSPEVAVVSRTWVRHAEFTGFVLRVEWQRKVEGAVHVVDVLRVHVMASRLLQSAFNDRRIVPG